MTRYATSTTAMIGASAATTERSARVVVGCRSLDVLRSLGMTMCGSRSLGMTASARVSTTVRSVLLVADVLEPLDRLAVERFLNRDVLHGGLWRRAVPVLFVGREPDDVAGADLLDGASFALREAEPEQHDERLTERVRVPGRARAGLEGHRRARRARGSRCREEWVDADRAGEPVSGPLIRGLRARARDVHGSASVAMDGMVVVESRVRALDCAGAGGGER